jgi:hypothetical protein
MTKTYAKIFAAQRLKGASKKQAKWIATWQSRLHKQMTRAENIGWKVSVATNFDKTIYVRLEEDIIEAPDKENWYKLTPRGFYPWSEIRRDVDKWIDEIVMEKKRAERIKKQIA